MLPVLVMFPNGSKVKFWPQTAPQFALWRRARLAMSWNKQSTAFPLLGIRGERSPFLDRTRQNDVCATRRITSLLAAGASCRTDNHYAAATGPTKRNTP